MTLVGVKLTKAIQHRDDLVRVNQRLLRRVEVRGGEERSEYRVDCGGGAKENQQKQQGATEHRREGAAENIGLV